ncbi:MAG: hypothetical protein R3F55_21340 [Alphaproteobacteria bacterium]
MHEDATMALKTKLLAGFMLAIGIQAAQAEDRLTPLLRFVPASALAEGGPSNAIQYSDFAAIRHAVGQRLSLGDAFTWSREDRELAAAMRIVVAPHMLANYFSRMLAAERPMSDYLGFGMIDIGQTLGFAQPPMVPMVLTGNDAVTNAAAVGAALGNHGFAAENRNGHTIWWYLDDNALDLRNRDVSNPLRGDLGGSARAGVVDGAFVAASHWGTIDVMLMAVDGRIGTAQQSPDMRALAVALDTPVQADGALLQAYLFTGTLFTRDIVDALGPAADEETRARLLAQLMGSGDGPATPRYEAVALADRQEGANPVGVVALSYRNRADAERATQTVAEAFATATSMAYQRPFAEIMPYAVVTDVVDVPDAGRAVARIAFVMVPETTLEGPSDNMRTPFYGLIQMLYRGDLAPLATAG